MSLCRSWAVGVLLLPSELAWLLQQGRGGAAELARRFAQAGDGYVSRSWRQPVV
ncbi:hypothetical protein [Corallococcus sicarius]|uniref:hypothetical protein n=1 Tax=Corallococcus sicarius TaxID=2316726 RepID=UPI00131559A4|nr:hypothetical protein [Corallococcus sicarius]